MREGTRPVLAGLITHLLIVKIKSEMSDASQVFVHISELVPNLTPVVKADVLIVGQPAVPIYFGHELPTRTMHMWHR